MTRSRLNLNSRFTRQDFFYVFIMFWLFLASLNFVTRYYYWNYIAFAVFLITPKRQLRINISTVFLFLFGAAILIFDESSRSSITNVIKPFVFMVAYTIGLGLASRYDDANRNVQGIKNIIYVCSFGFFVHYLLNLVTNFGALERDTIDIWTNSVLSATGQASLASMCVGVVAAFLFSETTRKQKIFAIVLMSIVILYNLILAGRTLLFMMVIIFALAFFYRSYYYKKNILKGLLIVVACFAVLLLIYNLDLFNFKTTFEDSNFYLRFFAKQDSSLIKDSRFDYKLAYIEKMWDYPFGGGNLRRINGFYAHDLYLDTYDQYGVFGFIAIVSYIISSLIRMIRCLRSPALPFTVKQLVLCVYVAINIQFWIEPIMQGMPWLLVSYCLIDGVVAHFLITKPDVEVADA